MAHGAKAEQVYEDEEGVQTMKILGRNMAYIVKALAAAKNAGIEPHDRERKVMTFEEICKTSHYLKNMIFRMPVHF